MLVIVALLQMLCLAQVDMDDSKAMQGRWKIVTVMENGKALSDQEVASQLVVDGSFTIEGMVIEFQPPWQYARKKLPYVLNAKASPKTIDLMGTSKIGAQGIYVLSGDSLMISLPGLEEKVRPADFGNMPGSHRVLLVLQRVGGASQANAAPAAAPARTTTTIVTTTTPIITPAYTPLPKLPPQIPQVTTDLRDMRQRLIGTWGHQTEEAIVYYTLNGDGTFSSSVTWKSGLKNTFKSDQRSSGLWSLKDGVIIVTLTASTESELRNQVFSWRVTNLGDKDLIAVDNQGRLRHEWKVR